MTMFAVIVYDQNNTAYNRSPHNRNVNVYTPTRVEAFRNDMNALSEYRGWFLCDTEVMANLQAESLAKEFPGKCVKVAKVICEYQSEAPKVSKKTVSEKGTLPT